MRDDDQAIFIVGADGVAYRSRHQDSGGYQGEPAGRAAPAEETAPSDGPRSEPFCSSCTASTTPDSAGELVSVNGIGHVLYGWSGRCDRCQSVIKRLFICILFIPIWPLARYRVIYSQPESNPKEAFKNLGVRRFYSRMLPGAEKSVAGQAVRVNPDRNRFFGALVRVIIIGLMASVGGIALFVGSGLPHPGARAECGGQLMSPGDVCQSYRHGVPVSGSEVTYEDEQYRVTHGHIGAAIIGAVIALVGLVVLQRCAVGVIRYRQGRQLPWPF
jgi:hypothetical protein